MADFWGSLHGEIKDTLGLSGYEKIYLEVYNSFNKYQKEILDNENLTFKPISVLKKIGRNDTVKVIYKNGSILDGKFKKFEQDIIAGNCTLM